MKTLLSLFIALGLFYACPTLGMDDDFYRQFDKQEAQAQQNLEDIYTYLSQEKKMSPAEILEMADAAPQLVSLALEECNKQSKLSAATVNKLLAYAQKVSRSEAETERLTRILIQQATKCNMGHVLLLKQYAHNATRFQEFVHQKQNIQK